MTSMISKAMLLGGVMSVALVGLAAAAPAAPADPAKVEKRVMIMRGGPGGPDGGRMRMHRPDPERHAQHLRDILQLTPSQEPALKAFIDATKPEMRMERRERPAPDAARPATPPAPPPVLTTPERLDRQAEMMAKRQAAFARRAAAIKTFYAQLTAPQKKAFDALGLDGPGGQKGGPRGRMMHRADAGDGPAMAFGPEDGDLLFGALEDFDIDVEMMPPPPPETPGA